MESTFISIHDISLDARLLYASSSIEDILSYHPSEVIGKSCWDYFHPDEIPFAQAVHGRSIQLDKAANLNYCRVKNKYGKWISCECVFTVVYDVLIASTSIYRAGSKSQKRARDAPVIRQIFSSSPRDPRYHMLQYISAKFSQQVQPTVHEPRAALFLNRFSRTLTIMYATNGLSELLGIQASQLCGKSFYYCIQENCLREAVKCLESAKANDSIAYLRFWFRDPRLDDLRADADERMSDVQSDEDDGGVHLSDLLDRGSSEAVTSDSSAASLRSSMERDPRHGFNGNGVLDPNSRSSSGNSTDADANGQDGLFDRDQNQMSTSSVSTPDEGRGERELSFSEQRQLELEAVVSCTSDGLVVILRHARPLMPQLTYPTNTTVAPKSPFQNGLFASPWASQPIMPQTTYQSGSSHNPQGPMATSFSNAANYSPIDARAQATQASFMAAIRDCAAFAWALTGINGSLASYGRGSAHGEAQPVRLAVWDPRSGAGLEPSYQDRRPNGYGPSKPTTRQATSGALVPLPRTNYDYLTGLPENGYNGSDQMQIDSVPNGSSADGQNSNGQDSYRQIHNGQNSHDSNRQNPYVTNGQSVFGNNGYS